MADKDKEDETAKELRKMRRLFEGVIIARIIWIVVALGAIGVVVAYFFWQYSLYVKSLAP